MPLIEKQEGLVLRQLDYKDRQKILTLFTKERGIISLIVKGLTRKNSQLLTLTSPLTHAEYHYKIHRSTLYTFQDGTLLNSHLFLRKSLSQIEAATHIAQALLISQLPEKPAPALYQLTLTYLKFLENVPDPAVLTVSFLLKLLKHEGILFLGTSCALCETPPSYLYQGEPFCATHSPHHATGFTSKEWDELVILTDTRQLETLQRMELSISLFEKVVKLLKWFGYKY